MPDITDFPERTTARQIGGDKLSYADLSEGDRFALRVSWHGYAAVRPVAFEVTRTLSAYDKELLREGHTPMASIGARGSDGHKYTIYIDNVHVECTTDDEAGLDRGAKAGSPREIDVDPDEVERSA
ncbi:hypothetical protein PN419_00430 [Halorubrum ezzemoulense]|uniref:hypothetical protein n=1 Tax=Halorubrum ezzemoulense TaxID=337243 RepID=UPI00232FA1AC|nr:hypothetical protein [Halorubrum ezzemoulense]MDB9247473.1 hypothetical protein [Halorubrum ezzemoulense]MDB9258618.1 hypothetical protein [Halorubrum ezzemoulense]MDB9264524.1 hypothetical protein [Halorubrum ezzemoulense]MDB9268979.1 hypothetical protein [Halorubrum ezzemoulense]MDB9271492.1 hypothetical protein [Halorubrum ezzemoulense]